MGKTHPVLCVVAALVARALLQRLKIQEGVAAHQALQLRGAKQLQRWAAAEHEEALGKCLELHSRSKRSASQLVCGRLWY